MVVFSFVIFFGRGGELLKSKNQLETPNSKEYLLVVICQAKLRQVSLTN